MHLTGRVAESVNRYPDVYLLWVEEPSPWVPAKTLRERPLSPVTTGEAPKCAEMLKGQNSPYGQHAAFVIEQLVAALAERDREWRNNLAGAIGCAPIVVGLDDVNCRPIEPADAAHVIGRANDTRDRVWSAALSLPGNLTWTPETGAEHVRGATAEPEAWRRVVVEANKALDTYCRKQFPGLPKHHGMPVDGVRMVVEHVRREERDECIKAAEGAMEGRIITIPDRLTNEDVFPIYRQGIDHAVRAIRARSTPTPSNNTHEEHEI